MVAASKHDTMLPPEWENNEKDLRALIAKVKASLTWPRGVHLPEAWENCYEFPPTPVPSYAISPVPQPLLGMGLQTACTIHKGQLVTWYGGTVYNIDTCPEDSDYLYKLSRGRDILYIDGRAAGTQARFINHSCEPNCEAQLFLCLNTPILGIISLHTIHPREYISTSYIRRGSRFDGITVCFCGAPSCPDRQEYLKHALFSPPSIAWVSPHPF